MKLKPPARFNAALFVFFRLALLVLGIGVRADTNLVNIPTGTSVFSTLTPRAVVLNEATNKIYVGNSGSGNVTVISGSSNTPVAASPVTVGSHPQSIAVDSAANKIYVANFDSNNVTVIDGSTDAVFATVSAGTNPGFL